MFQGRVLDIELGHSLDSIKLYRKQPNRDKNTIGIKCHCNIKQMIVLPIVLNNLKKTMQRHLR